MEHYAGSCYTAKEKWQVLAAASLPPLYANLLWLQNRFSEANSENCRTYLKKWQVNRVVK